MSGSCLVFVFGLTNWNPVRRFLKGLLKYCLILNTIIYFTKFILTFRTSPRQSGTTDKKKGKEKEEHVCKLSSLKFVLSSGGGGGEACVQGRMVCWPHTVLPHEQAFLQRMLLAHIQLLDLKPVIVQ